jgi:hypothetical protein
MTKSEINAGICGFVTVVEADDEMGKINITIKTDCPNVQKLAKELTQVEAFSEIFKRANATLTYELASKHLPHPSCPVPSGILKTIEVEAKLALPKDVSIKTTRK